MRKKHIDNTHVTAICIMNLQKYFLPRSILLTSTTLLFNHRYSVGLIVNIYTPECYNLLTFMKHAVPLISKTILKQLDTFGKQYCPRPTLRVSQLKYKITNL